MSTRNFATDARRADAPHCPSGRARSIDAPMDRALDHQARTIAAVINASSKLQQLRNRTRALEHALARLKVRPTGIPA